MIAVEWAFSMKMMTFLWSCLHLCVIVDSSNGDYDPKFRRCVWHCFDKQSCAGKDQDSEETLAEHLKDRLFNGTGLGPIYTAWYRYSHLTCAEHCMADCAYSITQERISGDLPIYKYFGHWSFHRYFGLEEPASVVFSLGNAVPHILRIYRQYRQPFSYSRCRVNTYKAGISGAGRRGGEGSTSKCNMDEGSYFLSDWAAFYPWVALIAWISSAVYHSKRTKETELLDLSTALILLWYGLAITTRRLAGPYSKSAYIKIIFAFSGLALAWRLSAMAAGKVPFQTHMFTAISIVILSVSLWIVWFFTSRDQFDSDPASHRFLLVHLFDYAGSWSNKRRMAFFQVGFIASSMLELFDFPPLRGIYDAHSLWHACTIPLGFIWYDFIDEDRAYMLKHVHQLVEPKSAKVD